MENDKFSLPQGYLYVSDLPEFIGIKPNSVCGRRWYSDEDNKGYSEHYEVKCDLYSNESPIDENQIVKNRVVLLSLEQLKEFEDALYSSETGVVLLTHQRGGYIEFQAGNSFSRGYLRSSLEDSAVHEESINYKDLPWWKKVLAFPDELCKILTELRLICETNRTVKNILEVKFDKSQTETLRQEVRSMRGVIDKLKDDNDLLRRQLQDEESNSRELEKFHDKRHEDACKEIASLKQKLINQEESVLREAEKIKSRINAEEQAKTKEK